MNVLENQGNIKKKSLLLKFEGSQISEAKNKEKREQNKGRKKGLLHKNYNNDSKHNFFSLKCSNYWNVFVPNTGDVNSGSKRKYKRQDKTSTISSAASSNPKAK
uniref:Uncharacterized protein n=1 Tax=Rhizophora mucronata TaxID=61149 RepID=A0A2P2L008_RHIMU